jgi:hypothetical protein
MLSSEFTQEMGALIRRLESRVREDPSLHTLHATEDLEHWLEGAVVTLCSMLIHLQEAKRRE